MTVSCIVCTIVYRRPVSTLITISPPLRKKQRTPDSRFVRSDTFCKPTQTRASSKFSFKLRANLFDCTESIHLKNFARFHLPFSPVFVFVLSFSLRFFELPSFFFKIAPPQGSSQTIKWVWDASRATYNSEWAMCVPPPPRVVFFFTRCLLLLLSCTVDNSPLRLKRRTKKRAKTGKWCALYFPSKN